MLEKKFTKSMIDDDDGDDAGEQCDVRIDRFFYPFFSPSRKRGWKSSRTKEQTVIGEGGETGIIIYFYATQTSRTFFLKLEETKSNLFSLMCF